MTRRLILALILVVYFALGALFAIKTPTWQAPDEPAHYNYIAYVVQNGSFPILHPGDYPHGYLEQIKAAGFPPDMPVTSIKYESHQPPLYYVLLAPVFSLFSGSLIALRLVSVLLGAGIVLFAYGVGRRAAPDDPRIALGAAAFVAFLPQHLATVSQVGNDVLAELLLAAVLFISAGLLRVGSGFSDNLADRPGFSKKPGLLNDLLLGVLLGLILITKTTAYIGIPLALGVLVWRWFREKVALRRVVVEGLAVILPAALIALPWYARDIYVYGWPDFLGLIRHEQIVVGQPRTAEFIQANGWNAYWFRTAEWTFKSFVGVFGWMGVWLDSRVYYLLGIWLSTPLLAWFFGKRAGAVKATEPKQQPAEDQSRARIRAFLAVSALLTLLTYVYYNITFLQHQGRYLLTALIPIAIFMALGWRTALRPPVARVLAVLFFAWCVLFGSWGVTNGHGLPKWPLAITVVVAAGIIVAGLLPQRVRRWAYAVPFVVLPLVAVYALFGAIVPALILR